MIVLKYLLYLSTHAITLIACQYFIQEDNFNDYILNYQFEDMVIYEGFSVNEIYLHITLGALWGCLLFEGLFAVIKGSKNDI